VQAVSLGVACAAALGKVLSTQYMLWLAPFAAICDSPLVLLLFAGACATTRVLIVNGALFENGGLADDRGWSVAWLAIRNACLLALTILLGVRAASRE
jgi:hypothetical protein